MNISQRCQNPAPGGPGSVPKWTRGDKDAVGTAYSVSSRVWYTVSRGLLNEIYYPTIDHPQTRDLQYLVTDGETFFHDQRRDLRAEVEALSKSCLGVRVTSTPADEQYRLVKEIIGVPHQDCVLIRTRLEGEPDFLAKLKLYVLCAPHLDVEGWHNNGQVTTVSERKLLVAYKGSTWLVLGASVPLKRGSCGFVGVNDGWTDLSDNYHMDWEYDSASDGNIALTGEIDLSQGTEFTLGVAFGRTFHHAVTTLFAGLSLPYQEHRARFHNQWQRIAETIEDFREAVYDKGHLYCKSRSLLLAHEDKTYPGAMVASSSIPWGETVGDKPDLGGYHLVWTRDLVKSVTGLLAVNDVQTPLRSLLYLSVLQHRNGGFHQNSWLDGTPYWQGIQLDEVALPILLAWRLHRMQALKEFDPYPMVSRAAAYLIEQGPATPQERWEEASGYSPATLAASIAALTCAAHFARERKQVETADFIQAYADFLEAHIEAWTVTTAGELHPDIPRYYIRINTVDIDHPIPAENPNQGTVVIANRAPNEPSEFPCRNVVDPSFLELVRYGVRKAGDRLIEDTLQVVDKTLKVETQLGPSWHRYNHDGYGQRSDGGPFQGWGQGRAWPLLTAERGQYELAAGRSAAPYLKAMENFASSFGLLPEQVWDEADLPDKFLYNGGPTGAAMPLMWAHAEYLKLVRSTVDGQPFDLIPEVADRYLNGRDHKPLEIWKFNRQVTSTTPGQTLRIQAPHAFRLRWTQTEWQEKQDTPSTPTTLGLEYVDIAIKEEHQAPLQFTFYWPESDRWEGRNYTVKVRDS
ncbi:MAG TPA: glycoside hydrolase family 15 protein [Anaerolineae bacterium]|nr:glycoside hydrolase family 15 protein [Anaerolineae bacterium]